MKWRNDRGGGEEGKCGGKEKDEEEENEEEAEGCVASSGNVFLPFLNDKNV